NPAGYGQCRWAVKRVLPSPKPGFVTPYYFASPRAAAPLNRVSMRWSSARSSGPRGARSSSASRFCASCSRSIRSRLSTVSRSRMARRSSGSGSRVMSPSRSSTSTMPVTERSLRHILCIPEQSTGSEPSPCCSWISSPIGLPTRNAEEVQSANYIWLLTLTFERRPLLPPVSAAGMALLGRVRLVLPHRGDLRTDRLPQIPPPLHTITHHAVKGPRAELRLRPDGRARVDLSSPRPSEHWRIQDPVHQS